MAIKDDEKQKMKSRVIKCTVVCILFDENTEDEYLLHSNEMKRTTAKATPTMAKPKGSNCFINFNFMVSDLALEITK